ncbi:acidic phospholipase A2 homolog vipoxin A chain-like [Dendrobates tinctorius]|uniref:acidic phospholipase A2 homolog vipoxin A chain-like n=1 Tax=Dendrobates tinctorius TaxID=92724 RepID=UPI003CC9F9DB
MIACLLLLLSLGLVEGRIIQLPTKNLNDMLKETMNKEMADALPYGCICVSSASNQNVEHIERCCALWNCCRKAIDICYSGLPKYTFTYSKGIIRCGEIPDISHCARLNCECERKTVMCLMNPENSEANSEVEKKCYRKLKTCPERSDIKKLLFGIK